MEPVIEFLSRLAVSTLQVIMGGHERFLTQNPDLWWVPTAIDLMIGIGMILIWYSDLVYEVRDRASHTMSRISLFPIMTGGFLRGGLMWWCLHLILTPFSNPSLDAFLACFNEVFLSFVSTFLLRVYVSSTLMTLNARGRDFAATTKEEYASEDDGGQFNGGRLNTFYQNTHTRARHALHRQLRWGFTAIAGLFCVMAHII